MSSSQHEIIGNYEVLGKDVLTRREALLIGAVAAGNILAAKPANAVAQSASQGTAAASAAASACIAKDFSKLAASGLPGLSSNQLSQHLKLYQGYVAKVNEIHAKLKEADLAGANATYSPFRELLVEESYALNGVVYHEFYFGNLGGSGGEPSGTLKSALEDGWGSMGKFMDYLKAAGKCMRGWVIVGYNLRDARLCLYGLDTHNMWVPTCVIPILALDVYEHAYMIDYGIDRSKYLETFVNNLQWEVVAKRFAAALKHPTGDMVTS
jgi:Fe-Mn family superoxide dismutase